MSHYEIVFTRTAVAQLRSAVAFWEAEGARELFEAELADALARMATTPAIAPPYLPLAKRGVRRTLLRRSRHHVYFRLDAAANQVIVLTIWHSARPDPEL